MRWIQTIRDVRLLAVILAPNFLLNARTHTCHTHMHTHTHTHTLVTHMHACRLAWSTLAWWWWGTRWILQRADKCRDQTERGWELGMIRVGHHIRWCTVNQVWGHEGLYSFLVMMRGGLLIVSAVLLILHSNTANPRPKPITDTMNWPHRIQPCSFKCTSSGSWEWGGGREEGGGGGREEGGGGGGEGRWGRKGKEGAGGSWEKNTSVAETSLEPV